VQHVDGHLEAQERYHAIRITVVIVEQLDDALTKPGQRLRPGRIDCRSSLQGC
jgi:hypothetical protein